MVRTFHIGITGEPDSLLERLPQTTPQGTLQWTPIPVLEFLPLEIEAAMRARLLQAPFDWVLFCSPRAVHFWTETLVRHGIDHPADSRVAVIGEHTGEVAAMDGYTPDFVPQESGSEGFVQEFLKKIPDGSGKTFLIPGAKEGRASIAQALRRARWQVTELALYQTAAKQEIAPFPWQSLDWIVLTSPSSAKAVLEKQEIPPNVNIACLGEYTEQYLRALGRTATQIPNADYARIGEIL